MEERVLERLYDLFLRSEGVQTDSRKVSEGEIFFALRGENFDGNRYAAAALEAGREALARLALYPDPTMKALRKFILSQRPKIRPAKDIMKQINENKKK